jgi:hypothetical protein
VLARGLASFGAGDDAFRGGGDVAVLRRVLEAGGEEGEHVVGEGVQLGQRVAVGAGEGVVGHGGRDGHGEADGGHDQRLADRAGDLVQRALAAHADRHQRVVDAPDGAEEADEGRARCDGGEEGLAVFEARLVLVDGALQRAGEEFVRRAGIDQAAPLAVAPEAVLLDGGEAVVHQVREGLGDAVLAQAARDGVEVRRMPRRRRGSRAAALREDRLDALGDDQVPGADRHDEHQDEHDAGDAVGALARKWAKPRGFSMVSLSG